MHIEKAWLTTTSTKKRKVTFTKAKQQELEIAWKSRNAWLASSHLPKQTWPEYLEWVFGRGQKPKKAWVPDTPSKTQLNTRTVPTEKSTSAKPWITGPCSSKKSPEYTGTEVIGICQMAKSNAVPVFNSDHIVEIARMRR